MEIRLTKNVTQLKDSLKVQTNKAEKLNKQLLEMKTREETAETHLLETKKQKETADSKCFELETTTASLIQEVEQAQALNETPKKYLQDAQVDLLSAGDEAFERAKVQALCIMPDLDVSKMDLLKTVVDDQLVDMEEASPEAGVLKLLLVDTKFKPLLRAHFGYANIVLLSIFTLIARIFLYIS